MANTSLKAMEVKAFQNLANNKPKAKTTAQFKTMADYYFRHQQPLQKKNGFTR